MGRWRSGTRPTRTCPRGWWVVAVAAMFFGDELRELFSATGKQTENVTGVVQQADLKANVEKIQKTNTPTPGK